MYDIDGNSMQLSAFQGKVIMIVNTASKCGFTGQYEKLQKIYSLYAERGLVILGFPANDFLKQEPGTDSDIKQFCSANYNVNFPMFSKISVTGKSIHPLYTWLTGRESNPDFHGKIKWNFTKFLVNRQGKICGRFEPKIEPDSEMVIKKIEELLEVNK
ncbi:MAG TPA: glutathione peroxidase [Spirochaetia bacterium]|nr:glutathione peroxidase [Spirochaetia bacterium]